MTGRQWRVPLPKWPPEPTDVMTDDEAAAEWARLDALATVREAGYIGGDHERMLLAGMPYQGVVEEWSFVTYPATTDKQRAARDLALWFCRDPEGFNREFGKTGLGFAGQAGRGKTGLAVPIAWELCGRGLPTKESALRHRSVQFVSWPDLVAKTTATVGRKPSPYRQAQPETLEEIMQPLLDAEVLIIDDLCQPGPDPLTRWQTGILQQLVWPRYDNGGALIVTTNMASADMEHQLGGPIMSRLYGMLKWCAIDGPDLRRRPAANS